MYRIALKNVGKDMVNRDKIVAASDINVATVSAYRMVSLILGDDVPFHFSVVGDEIAVVSDNITVGSLTITKLR